MIRKTIIASLLSLSAMSISQANDKIDALYERLTQQDTHALTALTALAKDSDPRALSTLGFIYEYGITVPQNTTQALQYYQQACEIDGNFGCYNVWYFYQYGKGVAQDKERARQFAEKMNRADLKTPPDVIEIVIDYLYSAKANADSDISQRPALIYVAKRYLTSGDEETQRFFTRIGFSKRDVLRLATFWAKDGDPEINFLVGYFYNFGYADIKNENIEALKWFRVAAEGGHPEAQNILGAVYEKGRWGIHADGEEAEKWYERAAKQGNDNALMNLGKMYYDGVLIKADYRKAYALFEQADKNDVTSASRYLSQMYYSGQYVDVDCHQAQKYKESTDNSYFRQCEKDKRERKATRDVLPALMLKHESSPFGGDNNPYKCELNFSINTNKLGEVANFRATLRLKNSEGASAEQVLAFPPFGLSSFDARMIGEKFIFSHESTLLPQYKPDFCQFSDLEYQVTSATATINGKEVDVLKAGILKY
ncbi:tetratricopeptide repeat protein [Pectobacterium parmentieri]|uniref:tetratricopeptide repeat protein n=1 Tax=Pectobacterium parmentieri TaxID=1905730 RepID=UPI0004730D27|nr:tetratricopeptide repeat protein [Pectobacterium parmentieri]MBN3179842.1 sel1 repeat family protein [Pectobacterium parmentieri]PWD65966.1 sel1 repeat family protein [Pectobacterium parmentieri]